MVHILHWKNLLNGMRKIITCNTSKKGMKYEKFVVCKIG